MPPKLNMKANETKCTCFIEYINKTLLWLASRICQDVMLTFNEVQFSKQNFTPIVNTSITVTMSGGDIVYIKTTFINCGF